MRLTATTPVGTDSDVIVSSADFNAVIGDSEGDVAGIEMLEQKMLPALR